MDFIKAFTDFLKVTEVSTLSTLKMEDKTMYDKDLTHRYRLETYDPKVRKHICPACEHRSFVRYIDTETFQYVSTEVGRCDREQKCGYHKTLSHYEQNNFVLWLNGRFGKETTQRVLSLYKVGTAKF